MTRESSFMVCDLIRFVFYDQPSHRLPSLPHIQDVKLAFLVFFLSQSVHSLQFVSVVQLLAQNFCDTTLWCHAVTVLRLSSLQLEIIEGAGISLKLVAGCGVIVLNFLIRARFWEAIKYYLHPEMFIVEFDLCLETKKKKFPWVDRTVAMQLFLCH